MVAHAGAIIRECARRGLSANAGARRRYGVPVAELSERQAAELLAVVGALPVPAAMAQNDTPAREDTPGFVDAASWLTAEPVEFVAAWHRAKRFALAHGAPDALAEQRATQAVATLWPSTFDAEELADFSRGVRQRTFADTNSHPGGRRVGMDAADPDGTRAGRLAHRQDL